MNTTPGPDQNEAGSTNWSTPTRYFALILIILFAIWLATVMAPLLQALGGAVLLALLLNPLVLWLMRRLRLRRSLAATLVFAVFLLLLVGIPVLVGSLAVNQIAELSSDLFAAADELQAWLLEPIEILGYRLELATMFADLESTLSGTLAAIPRGSLNLLSNVTTNVLWGMTVLVTFYYFLKDGPRIRPWVLERLPPEQQPELDVLMEMVEDIWGKFLRIQVVLFIVFAALLILGTALVIWLFRSGLLRWSPVGFVLLLVAVYVAVQQVDNLLLRPQYMGRQLQLHPGIVFVALIAGLAFGGLLGAIVVVPAIATARVVGRYLYNKILGLPPWTDAAELAAADEPVSAVGRAAQSPSESTGNLEERRQT